MQYPNQLTTTEEGLTIYVPVSEEVKVTYEKLCQHNESTAFPYWAKIWPAAKAMCTFLMDEPGWIQGKQVLEIGAGIGLPSLLIAPFARLVIVSDKATEAVELIEKNRQLLGYSNVKAICLDWNHFPAIDTFETVLLSDINYEPDQFEPLLRLIKLLLQTGATIIISTPQRITAAPFAEAVEPYTKRSVVLPIEDGNTSIDISILILSL